MAKAKVNEQAVEVVDSQETVVDVQEVKTVVEADVSKAQSVVELSPNTFHINW